MKRSTLYFASLFIMLSLGLSADNSNLTHLESSTINHNKSLDSNLKCGEQMNINLEKHIKNNPRTSSEGTRVITKPIDWKKPNAKLIKL